MSMIEKQIEDLDCIKDFMKIAFSRCKIPNCKKKIQVIDDAIDTIRTLSTKLSTNNLSNVWIPVSEKMPESNRYILVSFENCSGVDIARYEEGEEGGVFYPGDDNVSYVSCGIFVNAWQQLPEPYQEEI